MNLNNDLNEFLRKSYLDLEDAQELFICQDCVDDPILARRVKALMIERPCVACSRVTAKALVPEVIARYIRKHLPKHFIVDDDLYPGYALTLDGVVGRAIGCTNEAAQKAIAKHLVVRRAKEEHFYWHGQLYRPAPSPFDSQEHERWYVVSEWNSIAHQLTHGRRFYNERVNKFFESLMFEAVNAGATDHPLSRPAIRELPTGTKFFRARLIKSASELNAIKGNPTIELGAPPKERASNNRMSPAGIPLLYLSGDSDTCIAEVRPSIGDTMVVGQFISKNCLKLFDFTSLAKRLEHTPLSILDPLYEQRFLRRRLLQYLHDEIARPVRTNDTDYVVTQALAEFIRYDQKQKFDGVIFGSVQHEGGINYVLFDKSDLDDLHFHNWLPEFDVEISQDTLKTYKIKSVAYEATST
ncbi:RES domain-containing protein [Pseudomonas sp. 478]|uniref:RES family NAD+ phosphorylase n=1 Tax=unclassified Pseudomonas TaxID=196821 RepID=UPI000DB03DE6|nr:MULTISPECIES: RES family NAD+ phosphorylase [unclassified Pseudomonas]PZX01983.1 RES domain-containing protein [Pseudomonas sp. 478]TCV52086.1 RES domain-containing protein [Pseudomonas sp. 460]